jgi:hypothetical protein
MTFEDWGEVLRVAATIWPQSRAFFDDPPDAGRTPTRTWWAALSRFETDDVLTAVGRLGMTLRFWPSLADLVEAAREALAERTQQRREAEQRDRARLAAPSQSTVLERLAVFDHTSAAVTQQHGDELQRFVAHAGGAHVEIHQPTEGHDRVGVWERRLRELIARGWPGSDTEPPRESGHDAGYGRPARARP